MRPEECRQSTSPLPSPLKSPTSWMVQSGPTAPGEPPPLTLVPFISQMCSPLTTACQRWRNQFGGLRDSWSWIFRGRPGLQHVKVCACLRGARRASSWEVATVDFVSPSRRRRRHAAKARPHRGCGHRRPISTANAAEVRHRGGPRTAQGADRVRGVRIVQAEAPSFGAPVIEGASIAPRVESRSASSTNSLLTHPPTPRHASWDPRLGGPPSESGSLRYRGLTTYISLA
jgi:hypothetical protein